MGPLGRTTVDEEQIRMRAEDDEPGRDDVERDDEDELDVDQDDVDYDPDEDPDTGPPASGDGP